MLAGAELSIKQLFIKKYFWYQDLEIILIGPLPPLGTNDATVIIGRNKTSSESGVRMLIADKEDICQDPHHLRSASLATSDQGSSFPV